MSYYTLIASLPHLPAHFDVERPPISARALRERLKLLNDEDAATVRQLHDFLNWDRQPMDRRDEEVVKEYDRIVGSINNPLVRQIVDHRINVRTIVSSLRIRRRGSGPPIGVGPLAKTIEQNFQRPQFGLQQSYPWIESFERHLLSGDAVAGERLLYEETWQRWRRLANQYTFTFEAVLLYLARWNIVERWVSRDAKLGKERFEKLVEETLGDYASL